MTLTTPDALVLDALLARLALLSLIPVAWPGVDFTKPSDGKYIRVFFVPNITTRMAVDSDGPHRFMGILQLNVVWPVAEGELPARETAGLVANYFAADTVMVSGGVSVRSTKRPNVARSMPDGPDLVTPVSVEYESYI